jgi:tRNA threonylcarbamoyl adenosine modification protein (Sua5/YciO/YrdC/YwlC family)
MLSDVADRLQQSGAVGIIPTDTVYGVVARAADEAAVARLYAIKHREGKPGTIIAASLEQLEQLGLKHRYLKAVEQYWPGALSVVIPCGPELQYLHQGKLSLAVRIPDNKDIQALLERTGPLLTSSANHPGEPTSTSVDQAKAYFGDEVDFYIDGGDLSANLPSTIIRIVDDAVEVLRKGAVHVKEADIAA